MPSSGLRGSVWSIMTMDIEVNHSSSRGDAGPFNDSVDTASVWSESATQPLAIDAPTAATLLGVSTAHFYTLLSGGRIPPGFRLGRRRLWSVSELQRWIDAGAPSADRWAIIVGNCIRAGHRLPPRGLPGILKKQR